jgi:hypothetical protein
MEALDAAAVAAACKLRHRSHRIGPGIGSDAIAAIGLAAIAGVESAAIAGLGSVTVAGFAGIRSAAIAGIGLDVTVAIAGSVAIEAIGLNQYAEYIDGWCANQVALLGMN